MNHKADGSSMRNILAAMVVAMAAGGAGYVLGRSETPTQSPQPPEIEVTPVEPAVPVVSNVTLGRADIIRLANEAADAASGGPSIADLLDGRRFLVRIPFGCEATDPKMAGNGATYSVDERALRVRVQPQDWAEFPWIKRVLSKEKAVAVEGFWIPRPWTRSAACLAETAGQPDRGSWLGLAQLFDTESSRVGQQDGRALEATIPTDSNDLDLSKGLTLVLSGRVASWPTGGTVICDTAQQSERPTCLVGAELDSISVESARSGKRLSQWQVGT